MSGVSGVDWGGGLDGGFVRGFRAVRVYSDEKSRAGYIYCYCFYSTCS